MFKKHFQYGGSYEKSHSKHKSHSLEDSVLEMVFFPKPMPC